MLFAAVLGTWISTSLDSCLLVCVVGYLFESYMRVIHSFSLPHSISALFPRKFF